MTAPLDSAANALHSVSSQVLALVISHAHAPIARWRPLVLDAAAVRTLLDAKGRYPALAGLAVLATCSRTELYAEVTDLPAGEEALRALLRDAHHAPAGAVSQMVALGGEGAVRHLLRVASGLESIALGEHEILGQLRQALLEATSAGATSGLVQRLFERALATGGRARHETEIGRSAITLGAAAAAVATDAEPPSRCALAVVVGAGHMARQAARHLRARGFARLAIANRTVDRARLLADELHADAFPLDQLPALVARACVVVTAVHSATPLITAATLLGAPLCLDRPLQLVDLGSPPNIAPDVARIPGVRRVDLDTLHDRLAGAHAARAGAVTHAESIVQDEVARFMAWWHHRQLVPTALRLREQFLAEAQVVVEREARHLDADDRAQLERFADALVRRLLHRPLTHLQAVAQQPHEVVSPPDIDRLVVDAYLAPPPRARVRPHALRQS